MTYKLGLHCHLLLWLCIPGCIVQEPGTSVEVTALSSAVSDPRSMLMSDQGYYVQLDQLYIVLSRVELVPCAAPQRMSLLRELFWPGVAHAHGKNTPTAWAVPNVLAPLSDSAPISFAVLHPPAREYCSLRVSLEAADADAERMPSELDLSGLSMLVTGSYDTRGTRGTGPGVSFSYQSYVSATAVLPLVDGAGNSSVLTLSEDNLNATLRIELAYQRLFDGLALFPGSFSTLGDIVLSQFLEHASAVVLDDAG